MKVHTVSNRDSHVVATVVKAACGKRVGLMHVTYDRSSVTCAACYRSLDRHYPTADPQERCRNCGTPIYDGLCDACGSGN